MKAINEISEILVKENKPEKLQFLELTTTLAVCHRYKRSIAIFISEQGYHIVRFWHKDKSYFIWTRKDRNAAIEIYKDQITSYLIS